MPEPVKRLYLWHFSFLAGMLLGFPSARAAIEVTFSNAGFITIPSAGPATPYPSVIPVAGPKGTVVSLTVTLLGVTHSVPDDIDVLLTGPSGKSVLLMSDAGGSFSITGVTLTFKDGAPLLPDNSLISTGTYSPTNYDNTDPFPAPAPAPVYASSLLVFNGDSVLGDWRLFVVDDTGGLSGSIAFGWAMSILIDEPPLVKFVRGKTSVSARKLRVRGTAKDDFSAVKEVLVKVNNGRFRAAKGTSTWSALVRLKPGRNRIKAYATDLSGNQSEFARRTVKFAR